MKKTTDKLDPLTGIPFRAWTLDFYLFDTEHKSDSSNIIGET